MRNRARCAAFSLDRKATRPFPRRNGREECRAGSGQLEHEDAVAPLRVDLVVAAGGVRDVLLAPGHVRDRGRVHAGAAVVLPELLAGGGIESLEPAVRLAV